MQMRLEFPIKADTKHNYKNNDCFQTFLILVCQTGNPQYTPLDEIVFSVSVIFKKQTAIQFGATSGAEVTKCTLMFS